MVKNIIIWDGLSDSDKAELDKVLSAIYTEAALAGYVNDVYEYLTEVLDGKELVDMLDDLGVKFAKKEEDVILNDKDWVDNDNVSEIAKYIDNKISESDSLEIDFSKVDEMDDDDFENFLNENDTFINYKNGLKNFLNNNPDIRKQFIKFCIEETRK